MSAAPLINLIVWLIVAGLIYWLVTWLIGALGIPEPFSKIVLVVAVLVAFLICVNALLTLAGMPLVRF